MSCQIDCDALLKIQRCNNLMSELFCCDTECASCVKILGPFLCTTYCMILAVQVTFAVRCFAKLMEICFKDVEFETWRLKTLFCRVNIRTAFRLHLYV